MENTAHRAIAIVGVGAIMPDAPNVFAFWDNVKSGRYSISEVPADRWDPARYYDADSNAPDKTYSKIGGWVREFAWEPMKWRLPIPPRVADGMDLTQQWAVACTREALEDYGYPERSLDLERTAVILGNAMAGEKHYLSSVRIFFPEYAHELEESATFAALPPEARRDITREFHDRIGEHFAPITEDTMPGELANCMAGRIANLYNFRGPNYVCDAACASAMAAIHSAVEGLIENDFDVAVTGGVDRNMGAPTFVKFCKIGALSATGTRPYAEGADGFVMGEGAAIFLMKRLADAERDQDKIYAVVRGIGAASDGRGKGITAPNPIGQKLSVERAWQNAGLSPATATMIEGHGTSTRVGDVVEAQSMAEVLNSEHMPTRSVALGSVKSNIGHLKGAAGAAGILKTALALRDKVLPPSLHCDHPSPDIDFAHSPLYVNTELQPWTVPADATRRAGVSAFGFGGTNFHIVMEEHIPGKLNGNGKRSISVPATSPLVAEDVMMVASAASPALSSKSLGKAPLRGALVIGAGVEGELAERLRSVQKAAEAGAIPATSAPAEADLRAPERLTIDYTDAADLATKAALALKAIGMNQSVFWKALRGQGIFRGHGPATKVAFLYTGQGSQYANMLRGLYAADPIIRDTFREADRVMTPLLGKPLTEFVFVDAEDPKAVAKAEEDLRQTEITQPAVLAIDIGITRLLSAYGIRPDMTMGHSLGEYGALVASGVMTFDHALEAVSARGRGMARVAVADKGRMAAVFAPLAEVERILKTVDGYVVIANVNSNTQSVIGGASEAVLQAAQIFLQSGFNVVELPVSHAFHTSIVAPASEPLLQLLQHLHLQAPRVPIVANLNGEFYPKGPDAVPQILQLLSQQIASPVQFVKGLRTLYAAGARVFVEVGPKKALQGFAEDVLGSDADVVSLFTNHPKLGDTTAFNQALCGLYAAGLGLSGAHAELETSAVVETSVPVNISTQTPATITLSEEHATSAIPNPPSNGDLYNKLGRMFADVLDRGWDIYHGQNAVPSIEPVVITGAALGLPGTEHVFDDGNVARLLRGEQFIGPIPARFRDAMADKHITRLVKSSSGEPVFECVSDVADVIKLAGRGGALDLEKEFGVSADRVAALDRTACLAIGVGLDALRDAGIPLVMRYKTTSKGTRLPDRWGLPNELRDDTGVIFASAFPGLDAFAEYISGYYKDHARREQLATLESLYASVKNGNGHSALGEEFARRIAELHTAIEREPYVFDRRFLFRILSMGHSQFAEFIGARGPNTQINAACSSTSHAVTLAEDWIRAGRCRRVVVISSDDVTSDNLIDWMGAGFLASGAAATDEEITEAAIPFDRRRHGLILGMGAAALVVESAEAARERGLQPICEVLSGVAANSAFHGSRLDVEHICQVMETLVAQAETRCGISRREIAPRTVFVSHETYTPARGGSASAEIYALRRVFGDVANQVVITNTKGFTGHAMATGIEEVLAVKALESGYVPPVVVKEIDPELGALNLSKGGSYPIEYALRLGAGFGSQISMTLLHWVKTKDGARCDPKDMGYAYRITDAGAWNSWLSRVSGYPATDLEVVHRTLRVRDQLSQPRVTPDTKASLADSVPLQPAPALTAIPVVESLPTIVRAEQTQATTPVVPKIGAVSGSVKQRILDLVVDKTGYPADMLDLDLDLEADLGVDTVKQAEIFATVRETYNIPRQENLKLRDYPTLAHVIRFVEEKRPDLTSAAVSSSSSPQILALGNVVVPAVVAVALTEASKRANADEEIDSVREQILALAVEKTGYPRDMLDLDLDLEADLGVDTVKQAEMFAAIREKYRIPREENLKLRDYPTLGHVIRFVHEKRPDLAPMETTISNVAAGPAVVAESAGPSSAVQDNAVKESILALVVEKTGYPADMLDLDLDLEADLGIDTVKQAEMFAAIRALYNIPRDENLKLRDYPTLASVIRFVLERRPDLAGAPSPAQPASSAPMVVESTTSAPSPQVANVSEDSIRETILQIVAEKTGYPPDMLDLDLDLEADLGVDTVKQAEMFAAVRAAYNIPRDETLKLRDFPTLAHVIQFARDRRPGVSVVTEKKAADREQVVSPLAKPAVAARPRRTPPSFEAANRIPRRVPLPNLRPPLNLCKPTGVTIGPGSRIVIMPDRSGVSEALTQQLRTLGAEVLTIDPSLKADALTALLKQWIAAGSVQGVYWLSAFDKEAAIAEMELANWHEALRVRVKLLFTTMRTLYEQVAASGTFLVSATRLGGQHGYDEAGAFAPMGGSVTGFAKTYKREHTDALVKAIDFEAECLPSYAAERLLEETLKDNGAVEIGYKNELRWTIGLCEQSAVDGNPGLTLDESSVFLITGAAGSIVSAITTDLAAASGGTFYLLDLVPEPDPNNPDLKRFASDKDGLKRDLFGRIQARGERATPALVEKELASLERAQAALSAIEAVRSAGGTAHYFSVNLEDPDGVARVIKQVRAHSGRIDVMLHAAGLERSHFLPDKDPREFDLVFDVKADGWFNLLRAIGDMPLGATVAFTSIAGRFGNAGQADYSAANDLLCKFTSSFRSTRPLTRGITIDWTAWGGIGMATRGSIPKMMELAGIDMLPAEAGIPLIRRELVTGGTRGEIVVAQRLGALLNEWDATGGLDTAALSVAAAQQPAQGPMVGKITGMGIYSGLTMETTLDPTVQPFLNDHRIDGTPVLPGVMGIEAFAEAALCVHPGWHIETIEEVNFLAPFKFYRDEPRTVTINALFYPQGERLVADCKLIGRRNLPNQSALQETTHFTARVRVRKSPPEEATGAAPRLSTEGIVQAAQIYRIYFHGPAYQVLERAWWDGTRVIGEMASPLPSNHQPSDRPTLMAPRLIELCFQTAGLWEMGAHSRMGLPRHVHHVSWSRSPKLAVGHLYAVVTPHPEQGSFDAEVVDSTGNRYVSLGGYSTAAWPNGLGAESLKALQDVMAFEPSTA